MRMFCPKCKLTFTDVTKGISCDSPYCKNKHICKSCSNKLDIHSGSCIGGLFCKDDTCKYKGISTCIECRKPNSKKIPDKPTLSFYDKCIIL